MFLSVWDAQDSYENPLLLRVLGAIMGAILLQKYLSGNVSATSYK